MRDFYQNMVDGIAAKLDEIKGTPGVPTACKRLAFWQGPLCDPHPAAY